MKIEYNSESFDDKNGKQKPALNMIMNSFLVFIFECVYVSSAQNSINKIETFIPAKHEKH